VGWAELGDGCYLVLEEPSGGTLFTHWSTAKPAGAIVLGWYKPGKPVAKFKYSLKGGRAELQKEVR
jgi:hypothetical protein